jgi:hypothetical protein
VQERGKVTTSRRLARIDFTGWVEKRRIVSQPVVDSLEMDAHLLSVARRAGSHSQFDDWMKRTVDDEIMLCSGWLYFNKHQQNVVPDPSVNVCYCPPRGERMSAREGHCDIKA